MADETVWIDLDEVQSSAKTIMGLLKELEGPANQLEAAVKQVQASVYGTDLLGKSLQGGGSSVGGLAQHQEQVMAGIRVLMQNATAMGENLLTMAARHEANDEQQASELTRISDTGAMPLSPVVAGLPAGTVSATPQTLQPAHLAQPDEVAEMSPRLRPMEEVPAERGTPAVDPITPPAPIGPVSVPDAGVDYHDPNAPELHYNDNPNPLFVDTTVAD
ncbi:hypothetical protein AB0K51_07265 [Kitasatospora sp. NPDC049285]|uniref:WXG100 family type VII secretion target n=1 Tax=Kitasatospora sp. NPDC049285 TaxID=3157096 RepID=UPI00344A9447